MTRETALRVAAAVWGFALGVALLPFWTRPARPGQLPGLATALGIDANAPFRFVAALVILPIVFPLLLLPVVRTLSKDDTQPWARNTFAVAIAFAVWEALIAPDPLWVLLPTAVTVAACTLLRRRELRFTRRDVVLIPTGLTIFLAVIDLVHALSVDKHFLIAAMIVLALRIAVTRSVAFVAAPLALILQTQFFSYDQRHMAWPSLAIALVTPFVLAKFIRNEVRAWKLLAYVVYPLAVYGYAMSTNVLVAEGKPRSNVFEDAHGLVPASEMLRGDRPYRDILPSHGLIEDGLLDVISMRLRGDAMGTTLKTRAVVGNLNAIAVYAVAAAATGSAEAGVLAWLFATLTGTLFATVRPLPQLIALAVVCAAVRLRRPRLFGYAGFLLVLCALTSLDFAAYTVLTTFVALARFAPARVRALRACAVGLACGLVPLFLTLAILGIANVFVTSTLFEILTLGPVSTMMPYSPPPAFGNFRFFPEALAAVFDRGAMLFVLWALIAIAAGVAITMRVRRRYEPLALLAFWIAAAGTSYAARHHLHFQFAVAPLLVGGAWLLTRMRSRFAMPAWLVLLVLARITVHVAVVSSVRNHRGPLDDSVAEIGDVPRAKGVLFLKSDVATIETAKRYVDQHLGPTETFFDFTNRAILYYLFNLDCPIRQLGPAWYEPEERQRAVIAAIERDPRIRAALVPDGLDDNTGLDGVPNQVRAPLVWSYLEQHFEPQFREGRIVFWKRK